MKTILIVLGKYIKQSDPNGICLRKLILKWKKEYDVNVDIVCAEPDSIRNFKYSDNVYPVYYNNKRSLLNEFNKFINIPLTNKRILKPLIYKIEKLLVTNQYDSIIAIVNPAESAEAIYRVKMKHPELHTILYEIDPTSNRYKNPTGLIQKIWSIRSFEWEKKIYSSFNMIIHMKSHSKHFFNAKYSRFSSKTVFLDIPGVGKEANHSSVPLKNNTLLYAGAFYPKLREPDYMINLFRSFCKNRGYRLHIYTSRMRERIANLIKNDTDNIFLHNVVSEQQIRKIQNESDILISVGNSDSDYLPSKVLNYISTCKTIIHFYNDDSDVALEYFRKYPKCILVDQRESLEKNIAKITDLMSQIDVIVLDKDEVYNIFKENTFEFNAREILKIIS